VIEQLKMKSSSFFIATDPSTWLKPPRVLARRIHWELESWDELEFLRGMETIVALWDKIEHIEVSASNKHTRMDATFDVQSKEISLLEIQDSEPLGSWGAKEGGGSAMVVIKKWAEDHSFSFHERNTSQWRGLRAM
jgi:hypothetical protein